jgi:chemotaxis signal transduction protein
MEKTTLPEPGGDSHVNSSVVFQACSQNFSISANNIISIIKEPLVTKMPNMSNNVKGIIRYRDEIYMLYSLHRILELEEAEDEISRFSSMMEARKSDHIKWLTALEKSVEENTLFTLTTDPHACAFGKWYDNYKSINLKIQMTLSKFDAPHKKIHAIAEKVKEYQAGGDFSSARNIIEQTKNSELAIMIKLFSEVNNAYAIDKKGYSILLKKGDKKCAVSVDSVKAVERIKDVENAGEYDTLLKSSHVKLNYTLGILDNEEYVIQLDEDDFLCDKVI